jgi:glucose-6-phosphate isomerase
VEAGKKAARRILDLQQKIIKLLGEHRKQARTASEVAQAIGEAEDVETVYKILEHLSANPEREFTRTPGATPFDTAYAAL